MKILILESSGNIKGSSNMLADELGKSIYNQETEAAMLEARDIIAGKQEARRYSSAKELFDELDI